MLSTLSVGWAPLLQMRIGKGGQTSSASLTGVLGVQPSRRLRRRGDSKTMLRHRRQTCTSFCHRSVDSFEEVSPLVST